MLALQGDVREHVAALQHCDVAAATVRTPQELDGVDALILPGGESTTMSRLIRVFGLEHPLHDRLAAGMPVLATCAGLILLSREVLDGREDQITFGALDVTVRRNAYGRQVESFEADLDVEPLDGGRFRGVFIRAPGIEDVGANARVIASHAGQPVGVAQGASMGLAFHPEMTADPRLHRLFVQQAGAALESTAA